MSCMNVMESETTRRPNIILFNPDEMRWDGVGHLGNPAACTPFLDQMIQTDAVSFHNTFCQNPVCVPSRCSMFTGLYPHVHGHRTMQYLLHPGEDNLFGELKSHGYHVWMNDRNDLFAGQIPGWMESNADEIYHPECAEKIEVLPDQKISGEIYSHFKGILSNDSVTRDDMSVAAAIHRIRTWDSDQPLLMFLGLTYPHCPYQIEEKYYRKIDQRKLPKRVKFSECHNKSKMMQELHRLENLDHLSESQWDELRIVYLAMCSKIDDQFRMVCDALKEKGMYQNSLILFFSDHGDFTGDYGLVEKAQSTFEDCLTRVPLVVKPPEGESCVPGIRESIAELIDIYGTCTDYAGFTPQRTVFARSLRNDLKTRDAEGRPFAFCEGGRLPQEQHCDEYHSAGGGIGPSKAMAYYPKMLAQTDGEAHAKASMLRDRKYKYVSRITGEDEFYDLIKDPKETHNRIDCAEYQEEINKYRLSLLRFYQKTADVVPYQIDMRQTPQMMWNMLKDICPKELSEQVKDMIRKGMGAGVIITLIQEWKNKKEK